MLIVPLLLLLLGTPADKVPATPVVLHESSAKMLPVPPFGYYGEPQCDAQGDAFFHLYTGGYDTSSIFELARHPEDSLRYTVPANEINRGIGTFTVTPDGKVFALGYHDNGEGVGTYLVGFDSDGTAKGKTRLDLPDRVDPESLSVFTNGTVLVSGHWDDRAPRGQRGERYVVLFGPSGQLLKRLEKGEGKVDLSTALTKLPEGAAVAGEDGYVYLLQSEKVVVISASGSIVRNIPFTKPDAAFSAVKVNVSGGLLAITLAKADAGPTVYRYLVLDSFSGQKYGYYEPGPELGNAGLCFSREEGFSFLRRQEGKNTEEIVHAEMK